MLFFFKEATDADLFGERFDGSEKADGEGRAPQRTRRHPTRADRQGNLCRHRAVRLSPQTSYGYLHASTPERQAPVHDLMEPQRPIVDRKVLQFAQAHTFRPADFAI